MIDMSLADIKECMPDMPPSVARMEAKIQQVRLDIDRKYGNIWLGYKGDEPVAFSIGQMCDLFYTEAQSVRLTTIYIKPEHRNGFVLLKMVRTWEQWGRDNGAIVSFMNIEREDIQAAARAQGAFLRLGYKWAGSNFTRRL